MVRLGSLVMVPLSELVQVVVETGSLFAAFLTPQDAGGVNDATVQNRARQERCARRNIRHRYLVQRGSLKN